MQKVFEIVLENHLDQSSTITFDVIFRFVNDVHTNEIRVEHETVN